MGSPSPGSVLPHPVEPLLVSDIIYVQFPPIIAVWKGFLYLLMIVKDQAIIQPHFSTMGPVSVKSKQNKALAVWYQLPFTDV